MDIQKYGVVENRISLIKLFRNFITKNNWKQGERQTRDICCPFLGGDLNLPYPVPVHPGPE